MLKTAIFTLGLLAVAGSAQAGTTLNVLSGNALTKNALVDNALVSNGVEQNGASVSRFERNGLRVIEIELPSAR